MFRFFIGIYPYINYFKYGPEEDSLTYYFWALFFEKNKSGDIDSRSIISRSPNYFNSPYLKISLKVFGKNKLFAYSWLPNFFIYIFSSFFILFLLKSEDISNILIVKYFILCVIQINSISYNAKNIHYLSLSPRFMSMIFCSLFWFIYLKCDIHFTYFVLLILLSYFCISTSLFSRQTFIITNFIYSFLSFDINFLYIASGLLFYYIFNRGEFKIMLKNHFLHLKAYRLRNLKQNIQFSKLSIFSFKRYFFLQVLFDGKEVIILTLISMLFANSHNTKIFLLSLLIIYILISLRKFSFLGESYRYAEYSTFFIFPYVVSTLRNELILFFVCYFLIRRIFTTSPVPKKYFSHFLEIVSGHSSELKKAVWYSINYRMCQIPLCLGLGSRGFTFNFAGLNKSSENKYFSQYPYLIWNKRFLLENGVSHILVYKPLLNHAIQVSGFETSSLSILGENKYFVVYRFNGH